MTDKWPIGPCQRCGALYRMVPVHGSFTIACDCPPPRTWYSNNTGQQDDPVHLHQKKTEP